MCKDDMMDIETEVKNTNYLKSERIYIFQNPLKKVVQYIYECTLEC